MPFLNQIAGFINNSLKAGSLNKPKLQPAKFYGLSTIVHRSTKDKNQGNIEPLPATIDQEGKIALITPDKKYALQLYHKLISKTYSNEKKSYGDGYFIRCVCDMNLVVFTNSKLSGSTKEMLEPVLIFGMPQRISTALIADLGINNCLITPLSSNMDHAAVFRQEFPRSNFFLNDQMSMFLIRYKVDMVFNQACVDRCLCGDADFDVISTEDFVPIVTEQDEKMLPVER